MVLERPAALRLHHLVVEEVTAGLPLAVEQLSPCAAIPSVDQSSAGFAGTVAVAFAPVECFVRLACCPVAV